MELLAFGKTGWDDELFYATLMTIAVSITPMLIGFVFSLNDPNYFYDVFQVDLPLIFPLYFHLIEDPYL